MHGTRRGVEPVGQFRFGWTEGERTARENGQGPAGSGNMSSSQASCADVRGGIPTVATIYTGIDYHKRYSVACTLGRGRPKLQERRSTVCRGLRIPVCFLYVKSTTIECALTHIPPMGLDFFLVVVDPSGFEPLTSSMPLRRSTN